MAEKNPVPLKDREYWTALQAHYVLNIPYKNVSAAFRTRQFPIKYFDTQLAKAAAEDVRAWARRAPESAGGEWID